MIHERIASVSGCQDPGSMLLVCGRALDIYEAQELLRESNGSLPSHCSLAYLEFSDFLYISIFQDGFCRPGMALGR